MALARLKDAVLGTLILALPSIALAQTKSAPIPIAPGYRGFFIPISAAEAQIAKVGDRVDIIVAYDSPFRSGEPVTRSTASLPIAITLNQNVLVINVVENKQPSESAVELAVNPSEVQYLAWALAWGKKVFIAFRGKDDLEMHPMAYAHPNTFIK